MILALLSRSIIVVSTTQNTMLKRLPNGNLIYLPGRLTPYQAQQRMKAEERWIEEHREEIDRDSQELFDQMFRGD